MVRVKKGTQALQAFSTLAALGKNFQMKIYDDYGNEHLCDFLMLDVGTGKVIYVLENYSAKIEFELSRKPEAAAIIADGDIYIIKEFLLLGASKDYVMPEHVHKFIEAVEDLSNREWEAAKEYYDALTVPPGTEVYEPIAKSDAREHLLTDPEHEYQKYMPEIARTDQNECARALCGIIDPVAELRDVMENNKQEWIEAKAYNQAVEKYIQAPGTAEDWELRLAEAMRKVTAKGAKNVNITFTFDGMTTTGKINPDAVLKNLVSGLYFSSWEFSTYPEGCRILQSMKAEKVYCDDISAITYGGKEIYHS